VSSHFLDSDPRILTQSTPFFTAITLVSCTLQTTTLSTLKSESGTSPVRPQPYAHFLRNLISPFPSLVNINVKGVWFGCKYAIEAMRKNPGGSKGSIINTASFVALMGAATPQLAYTASKGAVLAMTRELAMVHAREGIRINSLCP